MADTVAQFDPRSSDFAVKVDEVASPICDGKELPRQRLLGDWWKNDATGHSHDE